MGARFSHILAPRAETLARLREKFPGLEASWQGEFGHDFSALTESEAHALLKFGSADAVRNRFLAARQETGAGGGAGGAGESAGERSPAAEAGAGEVAPPQGRASEQRGRTRPQDISAGPFGQTELFQQDGERWAKSWRGMFTAGREAPSRRVLRRSYVLQALTGFTGEIRLSPLRAQAIRTKHPDVPDEVWANLPALIANPRFAFPYDKNTTNVVLNAATKKGEPLIAAVRSDGEVQTITPRHDSEDETGEQRTVGPVAAAIRRGADVYVKDRGDASLAAAIGPAAKAAEGNKTQRQGAVSRGANLPYASQAPDRQSFWRPPKNVLTFDDVIKKVGRVFYQRGGAGSIYGDLLLGEWSRFGSSAVETLAGPSFGQVNRLFELYTDATKPLHLREFKGPQTEALLLRLLRENTPFANMILTKYAVDYAVYWRMMEHISPGWAERYERNMRQNAGIEYLPGAGPVGAAQ
jgi:hypothetical protein